MSVGATERSGAVPDDTSTVRAVREMADSAASEGTYVWLKIG